jgi:CTP synthase
MERNEGSMAKYVIVVGGVYSGTGKGISAASIGMLLKMRGENVNLIKCDPYLNINAGTMNPRQHGEVFLCDDGSETDLDLGHYERLTGITMSGKNIITNGTIYKAVLEGEERGDYLGETVQIVPHITDKLENRLIEVGKDYDVVIAEIGGTVGDYESAGMYEAIARFKFNHPNDVMIVMVAPILVNQAVKELKTKPLQNAVRSLRSTGLQCDMLLCRCEEPVTPCLLDKIAKLTYVPREAIFEAPTVKTIYQVPIEFYDRHVDDLIASKFGLKRSMCRIHKYRDLVEKYTNGSTWPTVEIAIVGKYENCDEAYVSLKEALTHAAVANNVKVTIHWFDAEKIEKSISDLESLYELNGLHGVIVPGGFDKRGVEGKIKAIKFCREKKIPFLGICLGLQCAVIEFARNVLKMDGANSEEFDRDCKFPVIHFVDGQTVNIKKSGTMRLGAYECELEKDTIVRELYKKKLISERHRHRYEVNGQYVESYASKGFIVSGKNPESGLVEMMELRKDIHPYFVGTQAHPEFKSRLSDPAPLFDGLVKAAAQRIENNNG